MTTQLEKYLLNDLRVINLNSEEKTITKDDFAKALSILGELENNGMTLKYDDIYRLCLCDAEKVMEIIKDTYPEIKAKPLYPDFPRQVINLDEESYRTHQLIHYFSVFLNSTLDGVNNKGLKPSDYDSRITETEKTTKEGNLIGCKVIQILNDDELSNLIVQKIVNKKERWTNPEQYIVSKYLENLDIKEVPFKENIFAVVNEAWGDKEQTRKNILKLCKHTGDVLDLIDAIHTKKEIYFKTSEKKMFCQVLQNYPLNDFKENLGRKRERNTNICRMLSFNRFVKDKNYLDVVNKLRNKEIKTWESELEAKIKSHAADTLDFLSERPGELLRRAGRLYREGFDPIEITKHILKNDNYKLQTVIKNMQLFSCEKNVEEMAYNKERDSDEIVFLKNINRLLLKQQLRSLDTSLANKKVYIDEGQYDLNHSVFAGNDKTEEGGYIQTGMAFKIPEEVKNLRFFTYWNDSNERVDVDLHAIGILDDNKIIHCGWNGAYNVGGLTTSGDITHNDAAEYIDIDLMKAKKAKVQDVVFTINVYTGQPFKKIEECFTGMMGVGDDSENVKLYNGNNVFFRHDLNSNETSMNYGKVNVPDRYLSVGDLKYDLNNTYNLNNFIDDVLEAQSAVKVSSAEEADIILVIGKPSSDNELSLIDNNFFLDSPRKPEKTDNLEAEEEMEEQLQPEL